MEKIKMVYRDITVIWTSMRDENKQSKIRFSYQLPETATDFEICEEIYRQTNLYTGEIFNLVLLLAQKDRPHTALSVNDFVVIDRAIYRVNDFGFELIGRNYQVDERVGA